MDQHAETYQGTVLKGDCLLCYLIALEETSHPVPTHQILLFITHGAPVTSPRHRRSGLQTIRHTLRIRTLKTHFLESCSHPHTCQQPCSATPLCCLGSPLRFKIKDCLGERMSLLRLKRMPPFQLRYKS